MTENLNRRIAIHDERPSETGCGTLAFMVALAALGPVIAGIIWILNR